MIADLAAPAVAIGGAEWWRPGLLVPVAVLVALLVAVPTSSRVRGAAGLASVWALVSVAVANGVALHLGWWAYPDQATVAGLPPDLYLAWVVLWGPLPVLAQAVVGRWSTPAVVVVLAAVDLVAMPRLEPMVVLGPHWLAGEVVALAALVPGLVLARLMVQRRSLGLRVGLQVGLFGALNLGLVPVVVLELSDAPMTPPASATGVVVGLMAAMVVGLPLIGLGLAAVGELHRAGGTPYPWDPTERLVVTGPYAYVRNPMQMAAVGLLVLEAAILRAPMLLLAAVLAVAFSSGAAAFHEEGDLARRFGADWGRYRANVPVWRLRRRPWTPPDRGEPARLWLASSCPTCSAVGAAVANRHPTGLVLHRAEDSPRPLARASYDGPDDGHGERVRDRGVVALAGAFAHLGAGWALIGWTLRLPVVRTAFGLSFDAVVRGPGVVGGGLPSPGVADRR